MFNSRKEIRTIPRFRDADGDYEIILECEKCRWTIVKDKVTYQWKECRIKGCGGKLTTKRTDHYSNPYKPAIRQVNGGKV